MPYQHKENDTIYQGREAFVRINALYDFGERVILPEGLDQEWQTHTSLKTTRIAFKKNRKGI